MQFCVVLNILVIFLLEISNVQGKRCYACTNEPGISTDNCLNGVTQKLQTVDCPTTKSCFIAEGTIRGTKILVRQCMERNICQGNGISSAVEGLKCYFCDTDLCNK